MREDNTTTIIVAVIGAIATIGAAIGGAVAGNNYAQGQQNQYIESQISNIEGNNNNVTINDVNDLVNEYNNLSSENETLKAKNTSYYNDLIDTKNKLELVEAQIKDVPQITYNSLGLVVDVQDVSINKNNSMVTIDGRDYFSKEITEKLLPDNKSMTIKDGTIFIGTVVANRVNLTDQWVVDKSAGVYFRDTVKDSYGNTHTDAVLFVISGDEIIFNLDGKYSLMKFTYAMSEGVFKNTSGTIIIKADDKTVYTKTMLKEEKAFEEIDIPIENCSLLTIQYSTSVNVSNNGGIISNAIVYN